MTKEKKIQMVVHFDTTFKKLPYKIWWDLPHMPRQGEYINFIGLIAERALQRQGIDITNIFIVEAILWQFDDNDELKPFVFVKKALR